MVDGLDILLHRVKSIVVEIDSLQLIYKLDQESRKILLEDIENAYYHDYGAWPLAMPTTTIRLRDDAELDFYPMEPLKPNSTFSGMQEAAAMAEVINAFRAGERPNLDPNPYHRALIRQGKEAEIARRYWNPYVSPWIYYAEDHPRPPLWEIILQAFLTILAIAVGLMLIYLLLQVI